MKLVTIGLFIAVALTSCGKPVCEQRAEIMGQREIEK